MSVEPENYAGGCLCGAVRWRATGPPRSRTVCHCRSCALAAGAPGVPWATWPVTAFSLEGDVARFASSPGVERGFCPRCGSTLTYAHAERPEEVDVASITLDDPERIAPADHIWTSDAASWEEGLHRLPRYAGWRSDG